MNKMYVQAAFEGVYIHFGGLKAKLYDKVNTTSQAVNMLEADNPKVRSGKQKNYYLKNYFKIYSSIYGTFHI